MSVARRASADDDPRDVCPQCHAFLLMRSVASDQQACSDPNCKAAHGLPGYGTDAPSAETVPLPPSFVPREFDPAIDHVITLADLGVTTETP